jgi:hypothetical protein
MDKNEMKRGIGKKKRKVFEEGAGGGRWLVLEDTS